MCRAALRVPLRLPCAEHLNELLSVHGVTDKSHFEAYPAGEKGRTQEDCMKVLLAVDGSDAANAVTQEVAARPWPKGSEFWLLTGLDPFFFTRAPLLLKEA